MRLIKNAGNDRTLDELIKSLEVNISLDVVSPQISLFAFGELQSQLKKLSGCRLAIPILDEADLQLTGGSKERHLRNQLLIPWLAAQCARWIKERVDVRAIAGQLPQSMFVVRDASAVPKQTFSGSCALSCEGLGIVPGSQLSLIQASEGATEAAMWETWFTTIWNSLPSNETAKNSLIEKLRILSSAHDPASVYQMILFHLFNEGGQTIDEDRIVKSATGIKKTVVWQKLFKFQRDGVLGAIDKLERLGGCIIADSVGLGKTFEALAVIKYYELRNDRVLVLCPKRLRDNWTLYASNDDRNVLAPDRLNYDVLNHTDLSRDEGMSGSLNLAHVQWGNYDLVVIDESHNFRNKGSGKKNDSRYERLMRRLIQSGVKTRVLMLSATPVNNRLADLKNQIAFVTEGIDNALKEHGIQSVESTIRRAQTQFNKWLKFPSDKRTSAALLDVLGFDYFKLLDLLTIARSRKHVEKYYGTSETGKFPERLRPINIKSDVDADGQFSRIKDINTEIRKLNLAAYAPMRYVLEHKREEYDNKYNIQLNGQNRVFKQTDREESLIHLLRVNMLKRMESSVTSFTQTIHRQLTDVEGLIDRIKRHQPSFEDISIDDLDLDDPDFEPLLVGKKVKVLLADVDLVRWEQDLEDDRKRLHTLHQAAFLIGPGRDAKLHALKTLITNKVQNPINPGNRKVILFTAFADTAAYLYQEISRWALETHQLHSALVTGTGANKTTLPKLKSDLGSILTAFSPRSKSRPEKYAVLGDIDLLIATDCISEGQNLQDCDYLINYDIHWNPVRIIQRFGRIDRIGSPNSQIQLVNFWPNMELNDYIDLEQRVVGRMVLLDISATGEENVIEHTPTNQMNDLEYRRKQLEKLQETVIDLEDLSSGLSIADLTLNDFRIDLASALKTSRDTLSKFPLGLHAVISADPTSNQQQLPPGFIFCLRAVGEAALKNLDPDYPLTPHYIVHITPDGEAPLPIAQTKQTLDLLKKLCASQPELDETAIAQFQKLTQQGRDMSLAQKALQSAITHIAGKQAEKSVASLFTPGGTQIQAGGVSSIHDFEVVAYLVLIANPTA